MKCLSLFLFLNLSGLLSLAASLSLTVDPPNPYAGQSATVTWTREASDPQDLNFDLRFVRQSNEDVGLAKSNIFPAEDEESGSVLVVFPQAGTYKLVAVTGRPNYENIGASREIESRSQPTTSSTPSSTSALPTSTTNQSPTNTHGARSPIGSASKNVNLPAIVGGVIGGLLLLTLLIAAFIYIWRRRQAALRRISFHKDLMVQRRSPEMHQNTPPQGGVIVPFPFGSNIQRPLPSYQVDNNTMSTDVESAYSAPPTPVGAYPSGMSGILLPANHVSTHLGTGHIVPSPRGPREPTTPAKRDPTSAKAVHFASTPIPQLPALPVAPPILTSRQKELVNRMVQLQNQMNDFQEQDVSSSQSTSHSSESGLSDEGWNKKQMLEDMQKQLVWLAAAKESKWALNETDIKPAGYSRYMTP